MAWVIFQILLSLVFIGCGREPDPPVSTPSPQRSLRPARPIVTEAVRSQAVPNDPVLDAKPESSVAADAVLTTYELRMESRDLMMVEHGAYGNNTYAATFIAQGKTYPGVKVRLRGAWSRSWPKKSLKIIFTDDQPFEGRHTINLNSGWRDPAFIREPLAYQVYGLCGALTLQARMVRLNVNGQFHGLYIDVEQPEKAFLRRYQLKGASLYKATSRRNQADERDLGLAAAYPNHYSKENQKTEGYGELQKFCQELARTTSPREFLEQTVDLEKYINYLAASVLIQNWDGYNKNHFLVYDGRGAKQWYVLPWDLDRTFGDHWNWSFDEAQLPPLLGTRISPGITGWNRLQDCFFQATDLRHRFLDRLEILLKQEFTPEKLFPILDKLETEIAAEAKLDRRRWPSQSNDLRGGIEQVKSYITQRRAYLLREIPRLRQGR